MNEKNVAGSPEWMDPDDAPELTPEMLADAEMFDGDKFVRRGPGRPVSDTRKEAVNVRLDADVLAYLRESGPGWQTRVNAILRAHTVDAGKPVIIQLMEASTDGTWMPASGTVAYEASELVAMEKVPDAGPLPKVRLDKTPKHN